MARIEPNQNPTPETQEKLDGIKAKLGMVPNIFQTFAPVSYTHLTLPTKA